jgi:hypothetical protein
MSSLNHTETPAVLKELGYESVKQTARAGARKTAADLAREGARQTLIQGGGKLSLWQRFLISIGVVTVTAERTGVLKTQKQVVPDPGKLVPQPGSRVPKPEDFLPTKEKLNKDIDDMIKLCNELGLNEQKGCLENLKKDFDALPY